MQKKITNTFKTVGENADTIMDTAGDNMGSFLERLKDKLSAGVDSVEESTGSVFENLKDRLNSATESVGPAIEALGDKAYDAAGPVGDFLSNPTLLSMLLGGTGAGLVGGYLNSRGGPRKGETREERRKRILMNALMAAGVGAATVGTGRLALENLSTAVPLEQETPGYIDAIKNLGRVGSVGGVGTLLYRARRGEDILNRTDLLYSNIGGALGQGLNSNPANQNFSEKQRSLAAVLRSDATEAERRKFIRSIRENLELPSGDPNRIPAQITNERFQEAGVPRRALINLGDDKPAGNWLTSSFQDTGTGKQFRRLFGKGRAGQATSAAALLAALFAPDAIGSILNRTVIPGEP